MGAKGNGERCFKSVADGKGAGLISMRLDVIGFRGAGDQERSDPTREHYS